MAWFQLNVEVMCKLWADWFPPIIYLASISAFHWMPSIDCLIMFLTHWLCPENGFCEIWKQWKHLARKPSPGTGENMLQRTLLARQWGSPEGFCDSLMDGAFLPFWKAAPPAPLCPRWGTAHLVSFLSMPVHGVLPGAFHLWSVDGSEGHFIGWAVVQESSRLVSHTLLSLSG